jgi:hypothetical protein
VIGLLPRRLGGPTIVALGLIALEPPVDLPPLDIAQPGISVTTPTAPIDGCAPASGTGSAYG